VKLLQGNPGLDVGVHLTLTSEWEGCKWGPLTRAPSLADQNGYFRPMTSQVGPSQGSPSQTVCPVNEGMEFVALVPERDLQVASPSEVRRRLNQSGRVSGQ